MARKLCTVCNTRTQYTGPGDDPAPRLTEMCNPCYTEGGWENTHSDGGHDAIKAGTFVADNHTAMDMQICWICNPEMNLAQKVTTPRTGHTNTVAKTRNSHAGHGHLHTPADRATCRRSIAAGTGPWDGK